MEIVEYRLIFDYYKRSKAFRSGVPKINHIDEGVQILRGAWASDAAIRAFCLHPMIQSDEDLVRNIHRLDGASPAAVCLAMEYRAVANAYLSTRKIASIEEIKLSPLRDVNWMLFADKVQNKKDFLLYNKNHPRAKELNQYFDNWLKRLADNNYCFSSCDALDCLLE